LIVTQLVVVDKGVLAREAEVLEGAEDAPFGRQTVHNIGQRQEAGRETKKKLTFQPFPRQCSRPHLSKSTYSAKPAAMLGK
jgi:hypothetical protein